MRENYQVFRPFPTVVLFILTLPLVTTTTTSAIAEPRGEIRIVDSWRPDINVLGHNVLQYLFEYALDRNELVPSLGISREWVDDTILEVKLREDVRFHNGEMFDAYAVKFNFEYQRKHNPGRGVQVYLRNLKEIRIVDRHTIRMALSEPDSLFLDKLILGPVAGWVIGAPRYMEEMGWNEFLKRPVGTGPYLIEGAIKDHKRAVNGEVYATLQANPHYWKKGYPKIKKIEFVKYSPKEALVALTEERVDIVTSLIPKDTLRVEESPKSKVVKGRNDARYTLGWLNLLSSKTLPLRDMRVRKALNYAVNREELKRYAYRGNAVEMRGLLTEKSGVELLETESYDWNIPKARELLQEAGYEKGFRMKLFYDEKDFLLAQLLQRFYSLLKIEVEITPVQFEWIVEHLVFPNTREGYSWKNEDWWLILYSDAAYVPEVMGGILEWALHSGAPWQTFPDWLMEPLDNLYRELRQTKHREKRFQIYKKVNEYIVDQAVQVFTLAPLTLYGVNEKLEFIPHSSQYLYLDHSFVTDGHWSASP